jgi:hypothetical protein
MIEFKQTRKSTDDDASNALSPHEAAESVMAIRDQPQRGKPWRLALL